MLRRIATATLSTALLVGTAASPAAAVPASVPTTAAVGNQAAIPLAAEHDQIRVPYVQDGEARSDFAVSTQWADTTRVTLRLQSQVRAWLGPWPPFVIWHTIATETIDVEPGEVKTGTLRAACEGVGVRSYRVVGTWESNDHRSTRQTASRTLIC